MHALSLGREYSEPFTGIGKSYPHEIANLCAHLTHAPACSKSNRANIYG